MCWHMDCRHYGQCSRRSIRPIVPPWQLCVWADRCRACGCFVGKCVCRPVVIQGNMRGNLGCHDSKRSHLYEQLGGQNCSWFCVAKNCRAAGAGNNWAKATIEPCLCLFVCLLACLFVGLFVCLFVFVFLSLFVCFCLFVFVCFCLFVFVCLFFFVCLSLFIKFISFCLLVFLCYFFLFVFLC